MNAPWISTELHRLWPFQKLSKAKACADTGLLDQQLFQRCLQFYSSVSQFLLLTMRDAAKPDGLFDMEALSDPSSWLPLPSEDVPKMFASLPEWVIDDLADFLLFALQ